MINPKKIYQLEAENDDIDEILDEIEKEEPRAYSERIKAKGEKI
jgi:hypothetical protein